MGSHLCAGVLTVYRIFDILLELLYILDGVQLALLV